MSHFFLICNSLFSNNQQNLLTKCCWYWCKKQNSLPLTVKEGKALVFTQIYTNIFTIAPEKMLLSLLLSAQKQQNSHSNEERLDSSDSPDSPESSDLPDLLGLPYSLDSAESWNWQMQQSRSWQRAGVSGEAVEQPVGGGKLTQIFTFVSMYHRWPGRFLSTFELNFLLTSWGDTVWPASY